MDIQDAHTHFFSSTFFTTLAKQSPRGGDPAALLAEVAAKTGLETPSDDTAAHTDRWLAEMDRAGVRRMVTFASVPPEAAVVAEAVRRAAGRLVGYTLVDPRAPDAAAFVERCLGELGLRGILLFPAMHHVGASDARLDPIYELARAHGAPVIVHCGILTVKLRDLLGHPRPYDLAFANPLSIVPAANRFRDVTFVIPHFGAGFLREALMTGSQCENVCVDSSSSNDWMLTQPERPSLARVFRAAVDVLGHERVLFGTDSSTFPRGWRGDLRDVQMAAMHEAALSSDEVAAVMGGNLGRLLPERAAV
ncbi:MAG: amidohydrolase family protein [Planctomycetes bacterium]|nr:amidohydrolase family protein [Planctomycetota bacterium]